MREIRIFELDRPGVPVSWRSARTQTIAAQAGLLWVTQEHQLQDIWLKPGQSIDVPAGVRFWLSGDPADGMAARFAVTEDINAPRRLLRFIGQLVAAAYRQVLRDDGRDATRTPSALRIGT
ncbi:DUF2917 domain-containing protein [Ralstonia insidiosa]|jgi:hypothetical protein|uniref:DUF2917 domain-containing protein n=1 Tax=Ralstonia TaxID=48736 RepID=UPI000664BC7A|nr:DUF2917 domain-containing protein [Ralstonia insidiosa]KMW49220.1 hypothetical protein AC240_00960 [Ralstonia sp. MD27]MBX3775047.1 DUF2917 domain-containing protein [Ralstonia pickettii]NOZ18118.1 DUF2917 domain-containing protein [Betaproteobacteria bacterium]MBA9859136.1 DUF2917 domain-containing protein [Ralstonia insidiosa]MBA9872508.1 DUF2917 domain-containing protein [Ralstonia insidiosa]